MLYKLMQLKNKPNNVLFYYCLKMLEITEL